MTRIASVILPLPLPEAFDYAEPDGMGLQVGDLVIAPLGPQRLMGVVSALKDAAGHNRPLKPILELREAPRLPPNTLAFLQWAARYAVDAPGQPLGGPHGRRQVLGFDLQQVLGVPAGHDEQMAARGRVDVHEGDGPLVLGDDLAGQLARDDLAEQAVGIGVAHAPGA